MAILLLGAGARLRRISAADRAATRRAGRHRLWPCDRLAHHGRLRRRSMRSLPLALLFADRGARRWHAAGRRPAWPLRAGGSLPACCSAYAVMALVWPWSVRRPLNPFRAIDYFSHFFENPWHELFGGALISVPDMPRSYVPTLFALKLPEIFSRWRSGRPRRRAGRAADAQRHHRPIGARSSSARARRRCCPSRSRSRCGRRCTTASGISCSCCRRWRCLAELAAAGCSSAARADRACAAIAAAVFVSPASRCPMVEMARLHPYEYTYFNRIAGGVARRASATCSIIGGCRSNRRHRRWRHKLAERHEVKPAGRRWKIAVCGPHRSPQVELGPDFEITWDPQGQRFRDDAGGVLLPGSLMRRSWPRSCAMASSLPASTTFAGDRIRPC